MVDVCADNSPDTPNKQDGIKDGNVQNAICNRRIEHTTTVTVVNNRFTTK